MSSESIMKAGVQSVREMGVPLADLGLGLGAEEGKTGERSGDIRCKLRKNVREGLGEMSSHAMAEDGRCVGH